MGGCLSGLGLLAYLIVRPEAVPRALSRPVSGETHETRCSFACRIRGKRLWIRRREIQSIVVSLRPRTLALFPFVDCPCFRHPRHWEKTFDLVNHIFHQSYCMKARLVRPDCAFWTISP